MQYNDRIYGKINITEPVILDLINTPAIQRLKKVDQTGYLEPFFPGSSHSRFEHSIGVFYLLKKYNASIEEQIAGLIHDVSHSAFSHCIDYIVAGGSGKTQCHQDNIFADFVRKSEIPVILEKNSIDLEFILNDRHFPLNECELPDLCADRIDYSLRTGIVFNELNQRCVKYLVDKLITVDNLWIFKNFKIAKKYAELFFKLNTKYYSDLFSAVMFQTVGDYLKHSLQKEYITKDDLYTTDKAVLSKIKPYLKLDKRLKLLYSRMHNKIAFSNNPSDYDARIFCKSRAVDPFCQYKNKIKRVSDIEPDWKKVVEQELKPKEYFIKFEK